MSCTDCEIRDLYRKGNEEVEGEEANNGKKRPSERVVIGTLVLSKHTVCSHDNYLRVMHCSYRLSFNPIIF
ncbi:UNVERIFIED_CONTAM: hypothetical protein FKN15_000191 [Acipenser sinensis]